MKQISIKKSAFAEEFLYISKSKPFSMKKYPFFYAVYDNGSDSLLLRCSRQVGKSLTVSNLSLLNILIAEMEIGWLGEQCVTKDEMYNMGIESFHVLYVSPTAQQASFFSKQKLNLIIQGSPIFDLYTSTSTSDQIQYKSFLGGSDIFLASCYHSPDSIRGITTDMIALDEIQDILMDHIPVILESQVRSSRPKNTYSGTPKTTRNGIEYYWKHSSQNEWAVKCSGCGKYNILTEENIQPLGPACSKPSCRKPLDVDAGLWVSMNPEDIHMQGFRIHAMMSAGSPNGFMPWTGDKSTKDYERSFMYKYETYPRSKFYNEVLGLPYDSGSVPITEQEIIDACDVTFRKAVGLNPGMHPGITDRLRDKMVTAGVDWGTSDEGKSRTVLCITTYIADRFVVLFSKIYGPKESDPEYQVNDILKWLNHYRVSLVGVDWGFGHMKNETIAKKFGNPMLRSNSDAVVKFFNHVGVKDRRTWDKDGKKFVINRTETMADLFLSIKDHKIVFPQWNEFKPFAEDIMNIYQEYNDKTRQMHFDHSPDEPDDFFFSLLYSIEVLLLQMGRVNI